MAALAAVLAACGAAAPAAQPPPASITARFVSVSAAPDPAALGAQISFREVGLRPGSALNLVATADGTARYACADAGGRLAGPSLPVTGLVSALRTLHAGAAGELSATIELAPAPPAGGVECAAGRQRLATSARYERIELSDVTNRVRAPIAAEVDAP